MFVVMLTYTKPIEIVESYLKAHRDHLEIGYQKNYLMASGPKTPRTGGVLLSQLTDQKTLQSFVEQDPFYIHRIATFEFIEFTPVKHHPDFSKFISSVD